MNKGQFLGGAGHALGGGAHLGCGRGDDAGDFRDPLADPLLGGDVGGVLDHLGGVSAEVNYSQPVAQADVQAALVKAGFKDPVVQYIGTDKDLIIRMPAQDSAELGLPFKLIDPAVVHRKQ